MKRSPANAVISFSETCFSIPHIDHFQKTEVFL